ncbi:MAG TPA: RIP metalloprotease RseP [Longimicrobiaceae bacterium]|nr:RIP metalloprotease RseP [Longimicrobiaceae bacterium]
MLFIVSTLVALSVLILVHEFGHFFAAKWVGIQVPRFSLGLGSRVAGFRVGETEFVVSAIPLGGYVKMAGMEGDESSETLEGGAAAADEPPVDPARTFDAKPIWARTLVISAGVVMNFLFAALVYAFLAMAYGEPVDPTRRVLGADTAAPPAARAQAERIPAGAEIEAIGGRTVRSWDEVRDALRRAPAGPVALRLAGAPPVTLELPAGEEERAALVDAIRPQHEPVIGLLDGGGPGARAGLRVGDRIVSIDGRPVPNWEALVGVIRASAGREVRLEVERGGRTVPLTVTPRADPARDAAGRQVEIGRIGAVPQTDRRRAGPVRAVGIGFRDAWGTTVYIATALKQLFTGEISPRNMGGLISIAQASGESARAGMEPFLLFLALLSVNLAVLNLLPIPILDGGHLLFLAIEAVRGRPLSVEARIRLSHVGLIIIVGLMLWANGNDLVRLVENLVRG